MLGNFGSRALDNGHDAPAARNGRAAEPVQPPRAAERPVAKPEPALPPAAAPQAKPEIKPETVSSIGSGMSVTGNLVCEGPMQIYGRVQGELRATEVLVGDSAQVEGNIVAQELIVRGRVKGTIRAVRVKLQGKGAVEGDIFHRSLTIEENALFEGSSRRVENPIDTASDAPSPSARLKGMLEQNLQALGQGSAESAGG